MLYRDLIPAASAGATSPRTSRSPKADRSPTGSTIHRIALQMIYVRRGWVRVVYEDQGEPFVMHEGDLVLQPPEIRHRVLESSAGLEVVEISAPALHETFADHELELPNGSDPGRHLRRPALPPPCRRGNAVDVGITAARRRRPDVATRPAALPRSRTIRPRHGDSDRRSARIAANWCSASCWKARQGSTIAAARDRASRRIRDPAGPAVAAETMPRETSGCSSRHHTAAASSHLSSACMPSIADAFDKLRPNGGSWCHRLHRRESPCCCRATTRKRRSRATVAGFRAALPGATIYVYDNNSRDRTREVAAQGGRGGPHRAAAGQGPCRPADVRRHRRRRLRDGRRRPDLRSEGRAGDGRPAPRRAARHGRRHAPARGEGGLSRRPRAREQAVHRAALRPVRAQLQRHLLGLPGLLAPVREELPGAVVGLRDRDRDERPRARAADAGRRGRDRLRRAARRVAVQAVDLFATAGGS